MYLADFDFILPSELIAQYPLLERTASRLLYVNSKTKELQHSQFVDVPDLLQENDLLIFNDTRVIPARFYLQKITGGKVEVLVERILGDGKILAHVRSNGSIKIDTILQINNRNSELEELTFKVIGREGNLFILQLSDLRQDLGALLEKIGHIPLPPYIVRSDVDLDWERYQTVFARENGAVAAPTAGLHFDESILQKLSKKGVKSAFITLHVGAGTFQPVRTENILEHKMHAERVTVSEEVCAAIENTKRAGGRVIAVGTTVVRSLETAAQNGIVQPFIGETDIFIYPGYKFRCIDAMLTNFHLPKSTLLMLVSAFAGCDLIKQAYKEAIDQKYRFFSYGDAMLIT